MKKQAVISILFTFILAFFVAVNVHAGNSRDLSDDIAAEEEKLNEVQSLYDEMQDKIDELEANKENLSNYLASLNQSYDAAQALIDNYDRQIADKQSEIESINGKLSEAESKQAEQSEALAGAYEAVGGYVDRFRDVFRFQRGVEGWAFLLTSVEEEMETQTKAFIEGLKAVIAPFDTLTWFGGIGSEVARIRELRYSFREADKAFAGRFVQKPNQIISVEQLNYEQLDNEFDANIFGEINQFDQIITRFLSSGSLEEVESFVGALFTEISEDHFRSLMIRQYIIMNIYATVLTFCKKLRKDAGVDGEAAGQMESLRENEEILKRAVSTAESVDDIKAYIGTLLDHAIELRNTVSGRRYSDIIQTAKKRIEQDYMSEDISLNSVAAEVCMSPSYFSSVFSKEMGKTFIEYLTEVRMEKAKQYLACSSMKTSEISYEVGYKDPHYFSYIFKKTQGCTPKEYRAARKG